MTLILKSTKQVEYHTDMGEIIKPLKKEIKSLNWLLTNQNYILLDYKKKGIVNQLDHESEKIQFSGPELLEILETRKIQFIWGVFCGFKGEIPEIPNNELPYADLNAEIWTEPQAFFHKDSEIEFICFDSSYTIVRFRDKSLEEKFKNRFTDAEELKADKNLN